MSSYTSVFGGQTINPTMLSYAAYTTAVDLDLVWSFEALDGSDVMAAKLDVTTSVASLSVTFPKASLVSVGQDVLIRNVGANTFSILDFSGATLGTVASGEAWYFYLTDNSTDAGTWESVQFGTGTSSASAASLAGYGLAAVLTRLNQNLPTTALLGNYTFSVSDCATVSRSGGGATTWTFPAATTLGGGWFVYIINAGTGTLTLTPSGSDTIDGGATKALQPDESCIVFCDGSNFNTLGYGRAITSTITAQSISIAGGAGTTTLSAVQSSSQVQNFTGAITGNRIVEYGVGAGYWFVYNNTTGAYSVTFRTDSGDAGCVVSQGSFSIIRSDGANMDVAFSATSGTVTNVATGTGLAGGPITTTGTISLANTAVTPGTYGDDPTQTVGFTVDGQGRLTGASEGAIAILSSQVTDLTSTVISTIQNAALGTTGGTANAITLTQSVPIVAYSVGQPFRFKTGAAANTTAVTLNVDGRGAGAVVATDGSALASGGLQASRIVDVEVVATTPIFQIVSQASTVATQVAGDNSTKVASTAFVQEATAKVYQQVFTGSGTYTPHTGMVTCIIECVGGGGAGGGSNGTGSQVNVGGGGGSGGYSRKLATAADIGASKTVTIGAGGTAGAAGPNAGGNGGDTSVGVLCIGKGGTGGGGTDASVSVGAAGAGGIAGTATGGIAAAGASGNSGYAANTAATSVFGAAGGSSLFGGGAAPAAFFGTGDANGAAASAYGSGGGGGYTSNSIANVTGGAGSSGIVIITEYCNQ